MKQRIETLKPDVLDLQKRSIEYNILKREVDTNQSLYDGLLQRYKEVDIAGGVGLIIFSLSKLLRCPAARPRRICLTRCLWHWCSGPRSRSVWLSCSSDLDDTLRSPEEVERALGYATLGIIPKVA